MSEILWNNVFVKNFNNRGNKDSEVTAFLKSF